MSQNWVTLTSFTYESEMLILLSKLEAEGIRYVTPNRTFISVRPMLSNAVGGIKVMVHRDDMPEALEILKNFENISRVKPVLDVIYKGTRYKRTGGFCVNCDETSVYKEKLRIISTFLNMFFIRKRRYYCNKCKHTWSRYR